MTNVNARPMPIQTADSIAASPSSTSWASRWKTRRSTSSSTTMKASSASHIHAETSMSTYSAAPADANTACTRQPVP